MSRLRFSRLSRPCFETLLPMPMTTLSKRCSAFSTIASWPRVKGSNDPGKNGCFSSLAVGLLLTKVKKQSNNSASPPENLADQAFAVTGCCPVLLAAIFFQRVGFPALHCVALGMTGFVILKRCVGPDVRIWPLGKGGEQKGKRLIAAFAATAPRNDRFQAVGFPRFTALRSEMTIQGHPEEVRSTDVRIRPRS